MNNQIPEWVDRLQGGKSLAVGAAYGGFALLLLVLYTIKAAVLRYCPRLIALPLFLLAVSAAVPLTWALSLDWYNEFATPQANYVGYPVAVLTVPLLSFLYDWVRWERRGEWPWLLRAVAEIFGLVIPWWFAWALVQFLVLNWFWI